eukprot:GSChrysophyteH1.ASY1.ANO1.980.1 assembled CDS
MRQKSVVASRRRLMLAMLGAATPELELSEILGGMLRFVKDFFQVDRVGIFVVDKLKKRMTLYMSQFDRMAKLDEMQKKVAEEMENADSDNDGVPVIDSLHVQVPLKGIAGHIAKTGEHVVLPDCYEHPLFDSSMDEKTGYRTKQMLCIPCYDKPLDGSIVAVLQVLNPTGVANTAKAVAREEKSKMKVHDSSSSRQSKSSKHSKQSKASYVKLKYAKSSKELSRVKRERRNSHHNTVSAETGSFKKQATFEKSLPGYVASWNIDEIIVFPEVWIRNLPLSARLLMQFYGPNKEPIAWSALDVFNHERELVFGKRIVQLWEGSCASPLQLSCWPQRTQDNITVNQAEESNGVIKFATMEFKTFDHTIVYAPSTISMKSITEDKEFLNAPLSEQLDTFSDKAYHRFMVLHAISKGYTSEPLRNLTYEDKELIWRLRRSLVYSTSLLPVFLLSVPWSKSECAYEAYHLLAQWHVHSSSNAYHTHHHAIESAFPDSKIRAYAVVQLLKGLSDAEVAAMLLPLMGALKFERHLDTALARFLIRRSIENPEVIGIPFYWHLKRFKDTYELAPLHSLNPLCLRLYKTLTELYRSKVNNRTRLGLGHAEMVHQRLAMICENILDDTVERKEGATVDAAKNNFGYGSGYGSYGGNIKKNESRDHAAARKRALVKLLKQVELPTTFDFPGNTKYKVNEILADECAYQKTWPYRSVKLVFRVDEGEVLRKRLKRSMNKCVIWAKVDVDPAPELVALSMLQAFDTLWQSFGLDLHVQTYQIIYQRFQKEVLEDGKSQSKPFLSQLTEVPMHAQSFHDILIAHNKYNDIETPNKTGLFGAKPSQNGFSEVLEDWPEIAKSGPKEYVSLTNREFPNDLLENWFCMHNFERIETRLTSQEKNLRALEPNHATVYEKYYNHALHTRRKSLYGLPSLSTHLHENEEAENAVKVYEPDPSAYEWRLKFARSLAGWYVSTYVLHTINRTAENIMFLPTGEVFNFEMNCFNIHERIRKIRKLKKSNEPISKPKESSSSSTDEHHHAPETVHCGYARVSGLHNGTGESVFATVHRPGSGSGNSNIDIKFRDRGECFDISSIDANARTKRANTVRGAIASATRKYGINTGSHINELPGGSGQERTHVPVLPCFTKILGPQNGSVFAYFREYALNAFTVLRSHPEFLLQTLKSSLMTLPDFVNGEDAETHVAVVVEALMANLMLETETDTEAARAKFLTHLKNDMAYYMPTQGDPSYPAPKRFVDR